MKSYDEYSKFIISEIIRLRERGYTYPEIVSNFKDRGIISRRNRIYYKNLLVNMIYKYSKKKIQGFGKCEFQLGRYKSHTSL